MRGNAFVNPSRTVRRLPLAIGAIPILVSLAMPARGATTITVSKARGTDIPSCGVPSSPCKTIKYGLAKGSDNDTIEVEAGTYAEGLEISKSVAIKGSSGGPGHPGPIAIPATTVIQGVGTTRVFTIKSGVNCSISNVIIQNAKSTGEGAAIANLGTLALTNSTIQKNALGKFGHSKCYPCVGGGISNRGTLTLTHVTVRGNSANGGSPGGIFNSDSTPENFGGGIYNSGKLTVIDSTIAGNVAGSHGGGGGIANAGQLFLTNSTVSSNNAPAYGGGIANACGAETTLGNVTVAANTTGIYNVVPAAAGAPLVCTNPGKVTVRNSIVANSTVGGNCGGAITSGGYNLDNGTTCNFQQPHDLSNVDPKLGPLADNGGGPGLPAGDRATQTHALLAGSAAVDAGGTSGNGCPATDQRGVTRPQGTACDIGSFERK